VIAGNYASPQDAEQAFYLAFEHADLVRMMAVWAEEEDIVCVHPGGGRHSGVVEVRESWRQIFSQGPRLRFRLAGNHVFAGRMLSIHSVYEHVTVAGNPRPANPVLSTNIYLFTNRGWRMLMHHASPLAPEAAPQDAPPPSVLH
jgi:ketosteroid isomerase-like protein